MLGGFFGGKKIGVVSDGGIFSKVRELLQGAQEKVLLVAPYVDPNNDLVRLLKATLSRSVGIEIWFRRDKLDEYQRKDWFEELEDAGVTFRSIENLHAKVYLFDKTFLVSSMNLTQSSWNDSREIGFVLPDGDPSAEEIVKYLKALAQDASQTSASSGKGRRSGSRKKASTAASEEGHCIRCNEDIPFNPERPYCKDDYAQWAEYKNDEYRDKYCHGCGDSIAATMKRPLCRDCFASV